MLFSENRFFLHVVIRGQHRDARLRIAAQEVQEGKQQSISGAAILRLHDDIRGGNSP